jgi:hypothetical protein
MELRDLNTLVKRTIYSDILSTNVQNSWPRLIGYHLHSRLALTPEMAQCPGRLATKYGYGCCRNDNQHSRSYGKSVELANEIVNR